MQMYIVRPINYSRTMCGIEDGHFLYVLHSTKTSALIAAAVKSVTGSGREDGQFYIILHSKIIRPHCRARSSVPGSSCMRSALVATYMDKKYLVSVRPVLLSFFTGLMPPEPGATVPGDTYSRGSLPGPTWQNYPVMAICFGEPIGSAHHS